MARFDNRRYYSNFDEKTLNALLYSRIQKQMFSFFFSFFPPLLRTRDSRAQLAQMLQIFDAILNHRPYFIITFIVYDLFLSQNKIANKAPLTDLSRNVRLSLFVWQMRGSKSYT